MKSSIAAPSLRNSGLLVTCKGFFDRETRFSVIARLVPTGTVLLMTTSCFGSRHSDRPVAKDHRLERFALPSAAWGVPTATKTNWAPRTADCKLVEKFRRP